MDTNNKQPYTRTGASFTKEVKVRGRDLVNELIGTTRFTQMLYFLTCDRMPTQVQCDLLDACLVTLMEHGLTPSAVITRLMAMSVPEEPQVAISSGLLAIGSVYAGTTEQCAALLLDIEQRIENGEDLHAVLCEIVSAYRRDKRALPGFGHGTHKPDDPRALKLFELASQLGCADRYVRLVQGLGDEVDRQYGRHVTINATGAIAALLLESDVPVAAIRGFSVVSRAAGLVGHYLEELENPSGKAIWAAAKQTVPYRE
ncbi:citrate synthase [Advenella kashmirensis W13003]|uniref:citrate synthase (unknown stereospecificity) n=1 Tax=Advenella kashmirensis W13003 TaxID=1424334 RepID=V8QV28_9BURK|nr:citryl-CoA lyase [Advenella kashmirensis]ETF03155.1 citrate synthase [Advenella kashmirensis W13003]